MADLLLLLLATACFLALVGLVALCDRIVRQGAADADPTDRERKPEIVDVVR